MSASRFDIQSDLVCVRERENQCFPQYVLYFFPSNLCLLVFFLVSSELYSILLSSFRTYDLPLMFSLGLFSNICLSLYVSFLYKEKYREFPILSLSLISTTSSVCLANSHSTFLFCLLILRSFNNGIFSTKNVLEFKCLCIEWKYNNNKTFKYKNIWYVQILWNVKSIVSKTLDQRFRSFHEYWSIRPLERVNLCLFFQNG